MAESIGVTQGGDSAGVPVRIATDAVVINGEAVTVQRVKLGFGADGEYVDVDASNGLPIENDAIGTQADASWAGSGDGTLVSIAKKLVSQFVAGFTMSGSVSMADAEGVKGAFGGITANPSQSFNRPANTTVYPANALVANSTTAGSVAYGTIAAARVAAGSFQVDRVRLASNHTSGLSGVTMRVRLWAIAAPTYNGGDGAAYSVSPNATGSFYLGSFVGSFEQFADVAVAMMVPEAGPPCVKLPSGQAIWWDIQTLTSFTPQSGRSITLTLEVKQD